MRSPIADSYLTRWLRVREHAVPFSMIATATARRRTGDWAGACAAADVDTDLDLRAAARVHGRDIVAAIRSDLRHLAPDLLRWHLPRIAPDGLLRPGLTCTLARYGPVHLVARTPPTWAAAGQRFSLALWVRGQPGPHPCRQFRLDLHRHLWDVRRAPELRTRPGRRWPAEAAILLAAEGRDSGAVEVRLGARRRVVVEVGTGGPPPAGRLLPVLPYAATWLLPDVELLRAGVIDAGRLHPLVADALAPGHRPAAVQVDDDGPLLVVCRGARHRIAVVDGVPVPLDHDPAEIRRERLLTALTGTPLPCLRAIEEHRSEPEQLTYGVTGRPGPLKILTDPRKRR